MPHSTTQDSSVRATSQNRASSLRPNGGDPHDHLSHDATEKFPDFDHGSSTAQLRGASPHRTNGSANGSAAGAPTRTWLPRKDSRVRWANAELPMASSNGHAHGHKRQTSISNAIRHMRSGSVSQNAREVADALRAPVSYQLIGLCLMWYWSSALTNTSSKSILTSFDKPATLTLVQFAFVSSFCVILGWLATIFPRLRGLISALKHPIRAPSWDVVQQTLPLAAFQIGGHLLSSTATSKIPVSLVHTIKGLSPLFTVLAYRSIFDIRYPTATYLSLVPLTLGVMLACSGNHVFKGQFLGILYALLATIIFVTQNIFSKRLFNEAARAEQEGLGAKSRKLDKLNLLCYSSGLAFILTVPIWFWSEGMGIVGDFLYDGSVDLEQAPNSYDHGRLFVEFVFNGVFHFGQNILAFVLLSMVSPVTYSVASLIKRVFVIIIAIIWFQSPTTNVQAAGIGLTFLGLYLYDRSSEKNKADQRARTMTESRADQPILPLVNTKQAAALAASQSAPVFFDSPASGNGTPHVYTNGYALSNGDDSKKSDDGPGRGRGAAPAGIANGNGSAGAAGGGVNGAPVAWLPPGTKQEETWRMGDKVPAAA